MGGNRSNIHNIRHFHGDIETSSSSDRARRITAPCTNSTKIIIHLNSLERRVSIQMEIAILDKEEILRIN